ncbi:MAG: hypothetical protein LAT68_17650 [Cyclobacteriaceae bacterium]|nr:hypothetical protein [Cyclobacteriaceae bacterium]
MTRKSKLTGDGRTGAALGMFRPGATYIPESHDRRYPMNFIKGDRVDQERLSKFLTLVSGD